MGRIILFLAFGPLFEALLAVAKSSTKNMRSFTVLLLLFVIVAVFIGQSQIEACVGHDGACTGDNGSQGNCCGGMLCQKNDPSWREGRCYYRPG